MTAWRSFSVPGEPISKARPRVTRKGNTYTPKATVKAEDGVRAVYVEESGGRPPLEGAVTVELVFRRYERSRRDADNMIKLVLDSLNGWAYVDDSQVESGSWRTEWVDRREDAGTDVRLIATGWMARPPRTR